MLFLYERLILILSFFGSVKKINIVFYNNNSKFLLIFKINSNNSYPNVIL